MCLFIFRHRIALWPYLPQHVHYLISRTRYVKPARREEAPHFTDCLTMIHYLFKRSLIDFPITYIGNMPRALYQQPDWNFLKVSENHMQLGDVVFVKNKNKKQLIDHVGLFLRNREIVHCSAELKTAQIQKVDDFFQMYEQRLKEQQLYYIDPRDRQQRNQYGKYLTSLSGTGHEGRHDPES